MVHLCHLKIDIRQERFHYECQDRFLIGLQLDSLL